MHGRGSLTYTWESTLHDVELVFCQANGRVRGSRLTEIDKADSLRLEPYRFSPQLRSWLGETEMILRSRWLRAL